MGHISNGLLLETKAILQGTLLYIVFGALAAGVDYFLGSHVFTELFAYIILSYLLFKEDFTLDELSYVKTKGVQILGDLIVHFVAGFISVVVLLIFILSTGFKNSTPEELVMHLGTSIFVLGIICITVCPMVISHIYLFKHVGQVIALYIQQGIENLNLIR